MSTVQETSQDNTYELSSLSSLSQLDEVYNTFTEEQQARIWRFLHVNVNYDSLKFMTTKMLDYILAYENIRFPCLH